MEPSAFELQHLRPGTPGRYVCFFITVPLLGSNAIVWLCDQEPVKSFQMGPRAEKGKLKRWWTYLSQFRLTFHHIPGIGRSVGIFGSSGCLL